MKLLESYFTDAQYRHMQLASYGHDNDSLAAEFDRSVHTISKNMAVITRRIMRLAPGSFNNDRSATSGFFTWFLDDYTPQPRSGLSSRVLQMSSYAAYGYSKRAIAARAGCHLDTAKSHHRKAYAALDCTSKMPAAELARKAIEAGLCAPPMLNIFVLRTLHQALDQTTQESVFDAATLRGEVAPEAEQGARRLGLQSLHSLPKATFLLMVSIFIRRPCPALCMWLPTATSPTRVRALYSIRYGMG